MKPKNNSSGFTLFEVLVVMGLLSLVVGSIFGVFLIGQIAWNTGQLNIGLHQQTRKAMDTIVDELHASKRTKVCLVNANTISLQVPLNAAVTGLDGRSHIGLSSGNLVWGADNIEGHWIRYLVENDANLNKSVLKRKIYTGMTSGALISESIAAYDIASVTFSGDQFTTNLNYPEGLEITISSTKDSISSSLTSMVFFKN